MFFSGHSLTDNPLPDYVGSIAQSLATPAWWNQQVVIGSPIRMRTRGSDPNATSFSGYSNGKNRVGSGMNVVSELRQPQTLSGQRYDTLVITERHDVVETLMWEGTVAYTRHFHERLIEGNPQATTYLYHSWLDVPDKSNPRSWIVYERAVAPAWQCVASRINESLQHEGRPDRIVYLPAGLALAGLVEQTTQGAGVPGVTGSSVRETMDRIFSDSVHLTPLGVYYMALVSYASVYQRSPVGAWAPPEVNATQAQALQAAAWQAVSSHNATFTPPSLSQCRDLMRSSVCSAFQSFRNRPDPSGFCANTLAGTTSNSPFNFNASTDSRYWYPAP
ncbi:MAG: hypothetical protein EON54_19365 [Alcaligenaceae bacterium]|nr:MAG: hypothetical protein EON54_19365 [Alcaligenaceae bacterium]